MLIPRSLLAFAACAAQEKTRYAMDGINIERTDAGVVNVTATNGKMLARCTFPDRSASHAFTHHVPCEKGKMFVTLPHLDESRTKGNETIITRGIAWHAARAGKARKDAKLSKGTGRPSKPVKVKRPKRAALPPLPKRASNAYAKHADETKEDCAARFAQTKADAVRARNAVKESFGPMLEAWKLAKVEAKRAYREALDAWRAKRSEDRASADVIGFTVSPDGETVHLAVPLGANGTEPYRADIRALEGHFPPVDAVLPKPNDTCASFTLDVPVFSRLVTAWRAHRSFVGLALRGDAEADQASIVRISMLPGQSTGLVLEGSNGTDKLPIPHGADVEMVANDFDGTISATVGIDGDLLVTLADALLDGMGAYGPDKANRKVRVQLKDAQSALRIIPLKPLPAGVSMLGVLMPVHLG